jgi:hypothetical protein
VAGRSRRASFVSPGCRRALAQVGNQTTSATAVRRLKPPELYGALWMACWVQGKPEQALRDHEAAYRTFRRAREIDAGHGTSSTRLLYARASPKYVALIVVRADGKSYDRICELVKIVLLPVHRTSRRFRHGRFHKYRGGSPDT